MTIRNIRVNRVRTYRIKVIDHISNVTYLIRNEKGHVSYISANETPLALSNLVQNHAAELRFALEDSYDGTTAYHRLKQVLGEMWKGNPDRLPKVELL